MEGLSELKEQEQHNLAGQEEQHFDDIDSFVELLTLDFEEFLNGGNKNPNNIYENETKTRPLTLLSECFQGTEQYKSESNRQDDLETVVNNGRFPGDEELSSQMRSETNQQQETIVHDESEESSGYIDMNRSSQRTSSDLKSLHRDTGGYCSDMSGNELSYLPIDGTSEVDADENDANEIKDSKDMGFTHSAARANAYVEMDHLSREKESYIYTAVDFEAKNKARVIQETDDKTVQSQHNILYTNPRHGNERAPGYEFSISIATQNTYEDMITLQDIDSIESSSPESNKYVHTATCTRALNATCALCCSPRRPQCYRCTMIVLLLTLLFLYLFDISIPRHWS